MDLRSVTTPHKLKASIGIEWRSRTTGCLTRVGASDTTNLTDTRVPKYTASILFLEVIAYILEFNRVSDGLNDTDKHEVPQCDEDVRRK